MTTVRDLITDHQRKVIGGNGKFADEAMFNDVLQQACAHFGVAPIDTVTYQGLIPRQITVLIGMLEINSTKDIILLTQAARKEQSRQLTNKKPAADDFVQIIDETARKLAEMETLSPDNVRRYINNVLGARKRNTVHYNALPLKEQKLEEDIAAGRVPSFTQIIEKVYKAKLVDSKERVNLNTLLWEELFPAWKLDGKPLSPERFCKIVAKCNQEEDGKETLTNSVIYSWKNDPKKHPYPESVAVLRKAFFDVSLEHEAMLWKIIAGSPFKNPYAPIPSQKDMPEASKLDKAIEAAESSQNHGPLVKELVRASGIPKVRFGEILKNQQLYHWEKGTQYIEDKATADLFISLTNPEIHSADQEKAIVQNRRILRLVTGKFFDIPSMLESVRESKVKNPGGALLILLTGGRKGMVSLSNEELAEKMTAKGCSVSANTVKKMRITGYQRGCTISEERARAIMQIVAEEAKIDIPGQYRRECIEMLTTNRVSHDIVGEPASNRALKALAAKASPWIR